MLISTDNGQLQSQYRYRHQEWRKLYCNCSWKKWKCNHCSLGNNNNNFSGRTCCFYMITIRLVNFINRDKLEQKLLEISAGIFMKKHKCDWSKGKCSNLWRPCSVTGYLVLMLLELPLQKQQQTRTERTSGFQVKIISRSSWSGLGWRSKRAVRNSM